MGSPEHGQRHSGKRQGSILRHIILRRHCYPSGGPVKEVYRIWKMTAPSLFTLAPDIYVPYTADVMETYSYLRQFINIVIRLI